MLCPGGCNNSYLVRGDQWTCYDTLSRARPRFPLFIPVSDKHYGVIRAGLYTKRLRTYLHGSVMQEQHLPVHSSIFALSKDQENIVECFESDFFHSKPFLGDLIVQNRYYFLSEGTVCAPDEGANFTYRYQPVEEPWLLDQHGSSHYAAEDFDVSNDLTDGNGIFKFHPIGRSKSELSSESLRYGADSYSVSGKVGHQVNIESSSGWWSFSRDDPVENPWLIYPSPDVLGTDIELVADPPPISESAEDGQDPLGIQELQHQVTEKLLSEIKTNLLGELVADPPPISESPEDGQNPLGIKEQQHQGTEKLLPEIKTYLLSSQDFTSTEILINCSICTMQRIAVLEDGNLVELLLEPVKSDVQCDSVYLGVVTKLVPNMGGAFVNIGSSCFMDIQHTREPFIFPPFNCNTKEKDVNGSLSTMPQKHLDSSESELASLDNNDTFFDEDTEVDLDEDDFDDHETEYDMDVEKIPERNFTSCVVNDNGTSANAGDSVNQLNGEVDHAKAQSHARGRKGTNNRWMAKQVWAPVREGTRIIVQVVKEGLGKKSPKLTPYPVLTNRFWILITRCDRVRVSPKISGIEHTRLKHIAKSLQPHGFGVTVRSVAAGRSMEELQKDLNSLLSTWRNITERAKSASLAADEGVEGAVPVILHQAMCQTLSVVQNYFNEKVKRMVVDSPRTYHEVTNYLQNVAPELCDRVELHRKKIPLFDEFNIEEEINNILNKRVALPNGGYLVIEQTEALVSIGVNGGHGMFGNGASQEKAILDVNLSAAKQIARELRLRDIGGIIIVDFIDMMDEMNNRLVYEEVKKAVARDRSMVNVSELSKNGLMEIIRKRVRPSVTFMISEPCTCCQGTGRVSALETDLSKIERKICRLLATSEQKSDPKNPKCWRRLSLRVDSCMWDYLTSGKKTRLATLGSSLKVWIHLQVERTFTRGVFEVKLFVDEKAIDDQHHQGDVAVSEQQETKTSMSTSRAKLFPIKKLKGARK